MKPVATRFTADPLVEGFALALLTSSPAKSDMLTPAELMDRRPDLARRILTEAAGRLANTNASRAAQALLTYLDAADATTARAVLDDAARELRTLLPSHDAGDATDA